MTGERAAGRARIRSLYLHIPFCERRCEYCDFVSLPGRDREAEYIEALRAEVRGVAARLGRLELDTVFVGGGTPSFVDPDRLGELIEALQSLYDYLRPRTHQVGSPPRGAAGSLKIGE